jgi:hypothetical protein
MLPGDNQHLSGPPRNDSMPGLRFSLLGVLGTVLVLALVLAVLISDAAWVGGLAFTAFFALLALALVGALVGRDNARVFSVGCAVFGALYAWCVFGGFGQTGALSTGYDLPSVRMLEWLATLRQPGPYIGAHVMAQWNNSSYYPSRIMEFDPDKALYRVRWDDGSSDSWVTMGQIQMTTLTAVRNGHAALGLLAALGGGVVSLWCFGQRPPRPAMLAVARSDAA